MKIKSKFYRCENDFIELRRNKYSDAFYISICWKCTGEDRNTSIDLTKGQLKQIKKWINKQLNEGD